MGAEQMAKNARIVAAQMKSDTAAINAKLEAARKAAVVELAAVNAASAARYTAVVKTVEKGVESARKWANRRFGHVYERMAKDRKTLDRNMGAAVANLNDQLAKQSAFADSRFSTTVKNIKAARIAAAKDVQNARKYFTTEIVALTSKIKQQETRLRGDIRLCPPWSSPTRPTRSASTVRSRPSATRSSRSPTLATPPTSVPVACSASSWTRTRPPPRRRSPLSRSPRTPLSPRLVTARPVTCAPSPRTSPRRPRSFTLPSTRPPPTRSRSLPV